MQMHLDNIGLCFLKTNIFDSAKLYFTAALGFIKKHEANFPLKYQNITFAKAVLLGNMAEAVEGEGDFSAAEELFKKSIQGAKSASISYMQTTQLHLADMYLNLNQLKKAADILRSLEHSLDTLPDNGYLLRFYKNKSAYYTKLKDTSKAFEYLAKYSYLKDSSEGMVKQFKALDLSKEFENREQKAANELLKKENELQAVYLIVAGILSITAVAIIILVWYNLKRSGKLVNELKISNQQVEEKNGMLEELNQEFILKNEDLQKSFSSLEQSHHENTRIIRIVAHDLRNPISAIFNIVYSLLKKEQLKSIKDLLELIKEACVSSLTLIKDLLAERKMITEKGKELVDIGRLLKYCIQLVQTKADEKNQQLLVIADHALIHMNRHKMWRVISNIINNAIKFSPENTTIHIKLESKCNSVLLSVEDHGIGIPEELKDKIFNHEPEATRSGTRGEESYGLGLAISQKIVEEHNGKLWFVSEAGKGSIFYVELPNKVA